MSMRGSIVLGFVLLLAFALLDSSSVLAKTKKHSSPAVAADPVSGLWYTEDRDGGIELYSCGAQICGRFYWLRDDEANGDISRDMKNPDPKKRDLPLCGMEFMTGFAPDGKGHYTGGTIYSPRHGADFNAEMTLADPDTLHLRGYLIFSFLGETQTWTRAKTLPRCAPMGKPSG